jgi:fructokinase
MTPQPARSPADAVLVLGEALVDVFPDGARVAGGAPFNVACWLAGLGVPVGLASRIGAAPGDTSARCLLDAAAAAGLSTDGLQRDAHRPTGEVQVQHGPDGPQFTIGTPAAWDHVDAVAAAALATRLAPRWIYLNTLGQRHPVARSAAAAVRAACPGARCFVDLNLRPGADTPELAAHALGPAQWVKVNHEELARLLRWFTDLDADAALAGHGERHDAAVAAFVRAFRLERLIVTAGAAGWSGYDADGRCDARGPAAPVPALVDSVGAGDAFSAALLASLAHGRTLADALQAAARLGAAACGLRGALPAHADFYAHWRDRLGLGPAACPSTGASRP